MAYSTVITAGIREKILADKFPSKIFRDTREIYESKIKSVYKKVADGCIELQDKVGNYANNRINVYLEKETEIRKILEEMPRHKIEEYLIKYFIFSLCHKSTKIKI